MYIILCMFYELVIVSLVIYMYMYTSVLLVQINEYRLRRSIFMLFPVYNVRRVGSIDIPTIVSIYMETDLCFTLFNCVKTRQVL